MKMKILLQAVLAQVAVLRGLAETTCLPNATRASDRRELVNLLAGESYPIGLWRNADYAAAKLMARVVQIVIQEKLGYKVELKGPGGLSMDGFYALAGCTTPLDGNSRGCGSSVTYVHINVEVWTSAYQNHWDQIQEDFRTWRPKILETWDTTELRLCMFR